METAACMLRFSKITSYYDVQQEWPNLLGAKIRKIKFFAEILHIIQ